MCVNVCVFMHGFPLRFNPNDSVIWKWTLNELQLESNRFSSQFSFLQHHSKNANLTEIIPFIYSAEMLTLKHKPPGYRPVACLEGPFFF